MSLVSDPATCRLYCISATGGSQYSGRKHGQLAGSLNRVFTAWAPSRGYLGAFQGERANKMEGEFTNKLLAGFISSNVWPRNRLLRNLHSGVNTAPLPLYVTRIDY